MAQNFPRAWLIAAGLSFATLLAAWYRLYELDALGLGNLFYAAAVKSMSASAGNFAYAALDPAGTLSIDKPPLALWVQVAATKALGFNARGLIGPMAIAGIAAVPLVFAAARQSGSVAVGLVAAVVLAVFPESVATARDSTMDALMMAMLAGAAWLLIAAVEGRRPRLLIAWAVVMGLVFNVKFFEGFVVMPAAALYIGVRWRHELRPRLPQSIGAGAAMVVVAASWVVFVEATPAGSRPRVLNDPSNSAVGLVLRYNGVERVLPGEVTIFAPIEGASDSTNQALASAARAFGVGDAGAFRLFTSSNGPLLGVTALLAIAGGLAMLVRRRLLSGPGLFWLAWGATGMVLFSFSSRAAAHYTESYAPALAVLAGVGVVEAARWDGRFTRAVPPALALVVGGYGWWAVRNHPPLAGPAFVVFATVTVLALVAVLAGGGRRRLLFRALPLAAVLAIPATAAAWITLEAPHGGQITRPNPLIYASAEPPGAGGRSVPIEEVLATLPDTGSLYRLGIDGVNNATEAIAYSGASVLPVWNEYRREPLLRAEELDALLAADQVPYLLLSLGRLRGGLLDEIVPVLGRHCALDRSMPFGSRWTLWRCADERAVGAAPG